MADGMSCRDILSVVGVRGGYGSPTLRAMHTQFINVSQRTRHIYELTALAV